MSTPTVSNDNPSQTGITIDISGHDYDKYQQRILCQFKWIELLILYLPSWTTKLPHNKPRNKCINIAGLFYVLASISFIIFTMIYEVISNPGRYNLFTIIAGFSQAVAMVIFKIVSVYYFVYHFRFDWYYLLQNVNHTKYAMMQVYLLNIRLIIMFLIGIMCAIYIIIILMDNVIYMIYLINIGLTGYVFQLMVSVLLLKYKIYLNDLKYDMTNINDEIVYFESEYTKMRDKMLKNIKPLQIYFILYFMIVITCAWLTVFGVIDDSLDFHYSAYIAFYIAVLLPLLEFCISSGLIAHQYSRLLVPYNKKYNLSDKNMITVDLILHRKPMIVEILGIQCTWQNFMRLLFTVVVSKLFITGFEASL